MMKKNSLKSFTITFALLSSWMSAQTLSSQLDKKTLALGEVATYKMLITEAKGLPIVAAPKNEMLPFHFEVVKDSIMQDGDTYIRTVDFAIYEEGKFNIPKLDVKIGDKVYHTVPYQVEVINTATKDDQINDIFNNKEVKLDAKDYWDIYKWYVLAALAVIAILFLIYFLIKYGRRQKEAPVLNTNKTLKALDTLKKKGYIEKGDFRSFYVELIDITREFITVQYKIPANVLLTDDLLNEIHQNNVISTQNEEVIKEVFLKGDLVKFAKSFPTQDDMLKDLEAIKAFVKRSLKDVELEKLR